MSSSAYSRLEMLVEPLDSLIECLLFRKLDDWVLDVSTNSESVRGSRVEIDLVCFLPVLENLFRLMSLRLRKHLVSLCDFALVSEIICIKDGITHQQLQY